MRKVLNQKGLIIISLFLILIIVMATYLYDRYVFFQYFFSNIPEIEPMDIIYLDQLGEENITCTGLTYSKKNNSFWIADLGSKKKNEERLPRLIETNDKFDSIKSIVYIKDFNEEVNLQGIYFDDTSDTLWIATGKSILNIEKNGNVLKRIELKKYSRFLANGIFFNKNDKTILVLLLSRYLLKYDYDGNLIEKTWFNYKNQDHIYFENNTLFVTIGASYNGNNNYILLKKDNNKKFFKMLKSYAIEGITIVDDKIYISNDGLYHNAKINKNYIAIYNKKSLDSSN